MNFETPGALWGLLSLALLVLFSLWRQAAVRTVVPSVLVWKKIPERNPPLRALRRPRWRIDLLAQALAVACLVLSLAGPYVPSSRPKPRRVALVLDTSARMLAGQRFEEARREAARLAAEKLSGDEVAFYAADPSPRRVDRPEEIRIVQAHVDLGPLLAVARAQADEVVVFSDRPLEGVRLRLRAGPPGNVGIVGFTPADDELFVRVVNHGPRRSASVRWTIDGEGHQEERVLQPGISAWSRRGDFREARHVSVEVRAGDGFELDDRADAVRLEPERMVVSLSG
ncbi:MAG: BatA domain-containing protein, partial [Planctomycetota bacterium]